MEEKITFESIIDKGLNKAVCEDKIGNFENFFWILDGGSIPDALINEKESTRKYVDILSDAIFDAIDKNPMDSLACILKKALSSIQTSPLNNTDFSVLPTATVVLVKISNDRIDYLLLGDSILAIKNGIYCDLLSDTRLNIVASDIRTKCINLISSGKTFESPDIKSLMKDLVLSERANMNQEGKYWIASFDPLAADKSICGTIKYNLGELQMMIFSDGFERIIDTYHIYNDLNSLFQNVDKLGLKSQVQHIRQIEKKDPLGKLYPRISFSDDIACIYIKR